MTELVRNTYVERVLIVLNPDGTLKGAAQYPLETLTDGEGNTLAAPIQHMAEPLAEDALATVLPESAALISQLAQAQGELAKLDAELANAIAANQAYEERNADLAAKLAKLMPSAA